EKQVTYKPVGQEETKPCWPHNATYQTNQPKYHTNLLIEGYQQEVVVPWLTTTRHLLLLYPVIKPCPDTVTDATPDVCEKHSKQDQENCPGAQDGEKPVRPGHRQNGIQHALLLWIN